MKSEVLIVGAGAVGCLTAMTLAQRGLQVTLVERGALGAESSWAGGGILFPLLPWNYGEPVNRLALAGAARYPQLAEQLCADTGIDPEYRPCGMQVLPSFECDKALAWCAQHDVVAQLDESQSLWLPQVAQVRNPRLLQALRAWLDGHGVALREGVEMTPVAGKTRQLGAWRSTAGELFEAGHYVITAGAWSRQLLGEHALRLDVRPMRGQMLLYRIPPERLPHLVYHEDFYLIPRADGHVLAGSTVEDVGFDKSTTPAAMAELQRKAAAILPELAGMQPIKQWSGLRPGSPDNVPVIARHPQFDNLWLNAGHFRYGVTMAPASAEILAGLMLGGVLDALPIAGDYPFPA
ncbi:MAG: glycine oxidase ThiO [Nitrosomonadales bacterium]|nr:MAG: glycine oxidase ThiO [Nitrosomonadales bacterium]